MRKIKSNQVKMGKALLRSLGSQLRPFACDLQFISMSNFTGRLIEKAHGFQEGTIVEVSLSIDPYRIELMAKVGWSTEGDIDFHVIQIEDAHRKLLTKALT